MATDILPVVVLTTEKLGAMTVYFAALTLVSDAKIGLDTLCLSVDGSLLFNVAPLASASGVLDRRVPLSVLREKAED